MTEEIVPIDEEEFLQRNKILRGKKRGLLIVLILLITACSGLIYLLQSYEEIQGQTLYILTAVMTAICLIGILLYRHFTRRLARDMLSYEKVLVTGTVVRSNFIGNTVYATATFDNDGQKYVTLDVDGKWMNLSGIQLRRLLPEAWQTNRIFLGDRFLMEFTPYGRHLLKMEKL